MNTFLSECSWLLRMPNVDRIPAARPGRDRTSGSKDRLQTGSKPPATEGDSHSSARPFDCGQHLRGQQMSFQAMILTPVCSTAYTVHGAGLRPKLSWTKVSLCEHHQSRVDSSLRAGLIGHHTSASDELYRAYSPRGAVVQSGQRQRNSLSYLEF